jgi:hypothetical protein
MPKRPSRLRRNDIFKLTRGRLVVLITSALLFPSLFIAVVDMPWTNPAVHLIFGGVAVGSLVNIVLRRDKPDLRFVALGKPVPVPADRAEIEGAAKYVARTYDPYAIVCFVSLLLDLPRSLARVHDEVEPVGKLLRINTLLQYRLDVARRPRTEPATAAAARANDAQGASKPPVLIPLITARKGLLFDLIVARSSSGAALPALSQWEARGLTALAVESLFLLARQETTGDVGSNALNRADREIMTNVITAVCRVGGAKRRPQSQETAPTAEHRDDGPQEDPDLRRINDLSRDISPLWREKITSICAILARSYIVVAEVPPPNGANLVVSYNCSYSPERMNVTPYEQLRARLGLSPYTLDLPMTRALHADSYHFELTAPPGCYIFSHHLEALGGRDPLRQDDFKQNDRQPYVRLYHEEGRSIAHLYVRRQGARLDLVADKPQDLDLPDFKSIVHLREIPPGALGNAAILATLTAIGVLFFTLTRIGLEGSGGSVGLPALVLALPAFLAAALGRGLDHERVGRASLTAYFGLQLVTLVSLAGVLLYVLDSGRKLATEVDLRLSFANVTLHSDALWLSLSFGAAVLAVFLTRQRRNATKYYLAMLERTAVRNGGVPAALTGGTKR